MAVSETVIIFNYYLDYHVDVQRVRFTAIPYAFIGSWDWNDIRRGVTSAAIKMKVGEFKR